MLIEQTKMTYTYYKMSFMFGKVQGFFHFTYKNLALLFSPFHLRGENTVERIKVCPIKVLFLALL